MISDVAERLSDLLQTLRTATAAMIVLRALLLTACLVAIALDGPLAQFFRIVLVVLALVAAIVPDSAAPGALMIGVLLFWLVMGHHPWLVSAALAAALAMIHLFATLAARGPVQAEVRPSGLAAGQWAAWLAVSAGATIVVGAVSLVPDAVPRGPWWVVSASIALVLAVLAVLALARRD